MLITALKDGLADEAPAIHGASTFELALTMARDYQPAVIVLDGEGDALHHIMKLRYEWGGARFVLARETIGPAEEAIVEQFDYVDAMPLRQEELIIGLVHASLTPALPTLTGRVKSVIDVGDSSGDVGPS
jgi:hypothetical protein